MKSYMMLVIGLVIGGLLAISIGKVSASKISLEEISNWNLTRPSILYKFRDGNTVCYFFGFGASAGGISCVRTK